MKNILKILHVIGMMYTFSILGACGGSDSTPTPTTVTAIPTMTTSTAGLTSGLATTTIETNLFPSGGRVSSIGQIDDNQGVTQTVPADVRYTDNTMPIASDLYNTYVTGHTYGSSSLAVAALDSANIVEVDAGGEIITAYIFADNYFEMYINGVPVGKDPVPFTDFNSNIVQFRVFTPFTVAMLLVDWEENLATGTESNQGSNYHPGDGGLVAVFKNSNGNTISVTDADWKAQTFYIAPLTDTSCLEESGTERLSSNCSTDAPSSVSSIYGAHWPRPDDWELESFDDSNWPSASVYTNDTVGVNNKPSYTNFINIFHDTANDASFIWSSNLILDNEVIVRRTIDF